MKVKLKNEINENNAFINVFVHLMYDIEDIRKFIVEEDFAMEFRYNIFSAMKMVFEKYEKLTKRIYYMKIPEKMRCIDNTELKKEFNYMFEDDCNIDDPIDVIFILINALHNHSLDNDKFDIIDDKECDNNCIGHRLFYINVVEQCNEEIYKFSNHNYFYEIDYRKVIEAEKNEDEYEKIYQRMMFLERKRYHSNNNTVRIMLTSSKYFNVLIANNEKLKVIDICKIMFMLPLQFENEVLFTIYDENEIHSYMLYSMIFRKGKDGYVIVIRNEQNQFDYYEDMNNDVFMSYKALTEFVIQSAMIPLLAIYKEGAVEEEIELNRNDYEMYMNYAKKIDKENIVQYNNEVNERKKMRPNSTDVTPMDKDEVKKMIDTFKDNISKRKYTDDNDDKESILNTMIKMTTNNEEEEKEDILILGEHQWKCERCSYINNDDDYRCKECNNFSYEIYKLSQIQSHVINSNNEHYITNNSMDYYTSLSNFKTSSTIPCYHCGHRNKYYKLKCDYCRFDISSPVPSIVKIQTSNNETICSNNKKYNDINMTHRDERIMSTLSSSSKWKCVYCNYDNSYTSYCHGCYRNKYN